MTKTDPLVTDEQIAQYAAQYVQPNAREVRRACEHMREAYEVHRATLLKERDEASVYLNTLLAMFENDGCVYTAQALESELKDEIIAFLSTLNTPKE